MQKKPAKLENYRINAFQVIVVSDFLNVILSKTRIKFKQWFKQWYMKFFSCNSHGVISHIPGLYNNSSAAVVLSGNAKTQ